MYKRISKSLAIVLLSLAMVFVLNGCSKKAPEGVIAIVNKEEITEEELDKEFEIQANVVELRLGEGVLDQENSEGGLIRDSLKEEVLIRLVSEEVIRQDSIKKDISVSEKEIDDRIELMKETMGGEEKLKDYKEDLGMDEDYLRSFVEMDILLSKHKEDFMKDLKLKDREVKKFFEENKEKLTVIKARQILVESEEEGNEILDKLKNGEDFKKLAIENSKDTNSVVNGGELGFFQKGIQPPEFDKVVFEMKKGDLSPLISTEKGYHIVEVQDIKDELEDLQPEIENLAKENEYKKHLEKLSSKAKIETYLEKQGEE